eukprot:TRINITY_DN9735_c0_g3_i1.p1 TRINITY_DN9735_c0_g3~~TRINITY_DN9735_c0_g3_i1.p1  ORF type:complete len:332 (+),score=92.34 TRINITY_DN9735_c0_g3_i1:69-1064(+)
MSGDGAKMSVTQPLAGAILAVSLLSWQFPGLLHLTALIPANTITGHFYFWNVFTAGVAESSPVVGALSAGVVLWAGRAEGSWGAVEVLKFYTIVTLACSAGVWFIALLAFMHGAEGWFYVYYCGDIGIAVAALVAMKQLQPESEVVPGVKLRTKWLPSAVVAVALVWELVFPTRVPTEAQIGSNRAVLRGTHVLHVLLGTYVSWFYLRFYQSLSSGQIGTPTPAFAFNTFFPPPMQSLVAPLCDAIFKAANVVCCDFGTAVVDAEKAAKAREEEENDPFSAANTTQMDHRRQIALQALEERMQKAQKEHEANADDGFDAFDLEIDVADDKE